MAGGRQTPNKRSATCSYQSRPRRTRLLGTHAGDRDSKSAKAANPFYECEHEGIQILSLEGEFRFDHATSRSKAGQFDRFSRTKPDALPPPEGRFRLEGGVAASLGFHWV